LQGSGSLGLGLRPSALLSFPHAPQSGGAHFAFHFTSLGLSRWGYRASVQHGSQLCDLSVDTQLLGFKAVDGSLDDWF
jgi:hypothetical protein